MLQYVSPLQQLFHICVSFLLAIRCIERLYILLESSPSDWGKRYAFTLSRQDGVSVSHPNPALIISTTATKPVEVDID